MSRRARREAVSSLSLVLPRPELPHRRSSLLSQGSVTSPQTPRNSGCSSPRCQSWLMTSNASNRKSTDSWNSSNADFGEEFEAEWKPEQILLLSRTLDALPAHLTPFNGPIPPSNLLDKIARGVSSAKGPNDWPHSLRATRVKLIEIARQRAKEDSVKHSKSVVDENDEIGLYTPDSDAGMGFSRRSSLGVRRPLYRQSSMDFMNTEDRKLTNNDSITRLSTRLQRTENSLPATTYHPYTRSRARALTQSHQNGMNRRSSSPPRPEHVPSLINPSTPSSSTLNSLSSISTSAARPRLSRRSVSSFTSDVSMLSGSSIGEAPLNNLLPSAVAGAVDPRMQRVRRSESFCGPSHQLNSFSSSARDGFASSVTPPPTRQTFKRAPSYGMLAQEARDREKEKKASGIYHLEARERMNASPCPSSDEEEKIRDKRAKKARVPGAKASKRLVAQEKEAAPVETPKKLKKVSSKAAGCADKASKKKSSTSPSTIPESGPSSSVMGSRPPQRMNLERNPSMFGAELPHLHIPAASPSNHRTSSSRSVARSPSTPTRSSRTPDTVPTDPQLKGRTLRRVKRLAPGRKISFGSLVPPAGEDLIEEDSEDNSKLLGSAFQLS
ncbi:hypothetical protein PM082_015917 [Marasmius tenuissimus]|nr:hypothetical protein PM082_015917 [Marasmius tenuissimus]